MGLRVFCSRKCILVKWRLPIRLARETGVEPARARERPREGLALFLSLSLDLPCVLGLDGCFKRVSPAWEACLGWTSAELVDRPFLDFAHPDDRAATAAVIGKIAETSATIAFENRFRGRDGDDRRLKWNALFSPERRVICASARDVTGQERLKRELIEAGDREKERMGRELHDGLCQNLAGIAALSATLARKLAARDDPAAGGRCRDHRLAAADDRRRPRSRARPQRRGPRADGARRRAGGAGGECRGASRDHVRLRLRSSIFLVWTPRSRHISIASPRRR